MNGSRVERLAPLTGALSVGLFILGIVIIGSYEFLPPADRLVEFFGDNSSRVMWGAYLGELGAFFLIWFAASVHSALHERDAARGRASQAAFGGGVAAGVAAAAAFAAMIIAAERSAADGGLSAAEAATLYDLWSTLLGDVFPISLAVLVGGAGVASLRRPVFPAWFGWLSVVIAVGCLSPIGYELQGLAVVWVLLLSIWLYVRGAESAAIR